MTSWRNIKAGREINAEQDNGKEDEEKEELH